MRRSMKRRIIKIVVLLVFFLAAAAAAFWFSRQPKDFTKTIVKMEEPTLPIIEAQVENTYVNVMHGYVNDMNDRYMRDTVTPLPENRELKLRMKERGDAIKSLRYEIRSMDTTRLVENTKVETLERKEIGQEEYVTATLPIQNLLDTNQEYLLMIFLQTEKREEIAYYTRIVKAPSYPVARMIAFVKDFHDKTLKAPRNAGIATYLKTNTDTSKDLGHVSLNSSYSAVLWHYLLPTQTCESRLNIMDISSSVGTFRLDSQVAFQDALGEEHICDVTERFTVQYANRSWYVLGYERDATEVMDQVKIREGRKQISLGITNDSSLEMLASPSGYCQALVHNGNLWLNQAKEDSEGSAVWSRIFSFEGEDPKAQAEADNYGLKIVEVKDNGDCSFLLYGYMKNGRHEGEVGLAYYDYSAEEKLLDERFYLPFDRSAEFLMREMGKLSYINESELFYLMLNGKIYAIDFAGREYMTIVENVADESLAINDNRNVVAWEEEITEKGAGRIVILYLDDGHQNIVTANEGESLHVLGFIESDLAVGKIKDSDHQTYSSKTQYPMYAMDIISTYGTVVGKYEKDGLMITSASVENGGIRIHRSKKNGTSLTPASDDALIGNDGQAMTKEEMLAKVRTDEGYLNTYLTVYDTAANTTPVFVENISMSDSSYLKINLNGFGEDDKFFAYSKGRLQTVTDSIVDAVDAVYDEIGYVTDSNGNYVLRRGYRGYFTIPINTIMRASSKEDRTEVVLHVISAYEGGSFSQSLQSMKEEGLSKAAMLQMGVNGYVYDLTGCSLSQIAYYYLAKHHPIYAETSQGAVLITGISSENVYVWDPMTGEVNPMEISAAEKEFARAGNVFISCLDED